MVSDQDSIQQAATCEPFEMTHLRMREAHLMSEVDRLSAEGAILASIVRNYADHTNKCEYWHFYDESGCTCGLTKAMQEWETPASTGQTAYLVHRKCGIDHYFSADRNDNCEICGRPSHNKRIAAADSKPNSTLPQTQDEADSMLSAGEHSVESVQENTCCGDASHGCAARQRETNE